MKVLQLPNKTNAKSNQLSISRLFAWIALFAFSLSAFTFALKGGNGWLVGYSRVVVFSLGLIVAILLFGEMFRRIKRWIVWPVLMACAFVCVGTLVLIWYVNSFIPIFIERGVADDGKIEFKKLTVDPRNGIVIKYHVWDLPDCENTGYLIPWRDGYRSLSDEYLNRQE